MSQQALLAAIASQQTETNRLLIVISGEEAWCVSQAESVFQAQPRYWWFGKGVASAYDIAKAKQYLGQSCQGLIFNGYSGFHPNALAAVSGCVEAGGCLILLLPDLSQWPDYDCPDYSRLQVHGWVESHPKFFLKRCAELINANGSILKWQQHDVFSEASLLKAADQAPVAQPYKSSCQQAAVGAIIKTASGRRHRPLVITAARGRGKSASLGLAARQLLSTGKRLVLVAPNKGAVSSVYERLYNDQTLAFFVPDQFDQQQPEADLILVDEAAAIPVPMLLRWVQRHPRIVFSSTTFGYEGHGQGFLKRFIAALKQRYPQFKQQPLHTPIRWQAPCALEQTIDALFLLSFEERILQSAELHRFQEITQSQLLADECLFQRVYGLLVSAHYQTTPDDLRVLLDGVNIRLFAAICGEQIVSVAMVAVEGPIEHGLQQAIYEGKRRVKGHVAPQFWVSHTATPEMLNLRCWRVVRIATDAANQRQKLASKLLTVIAQKAVEDNASYVASVFAVSEQVLPFWTANGFYTAALNNKVDSVSACLTGLVVKSLNSQSDALIEPQLRYFCQQLPLLLQQQALVIRSQQVAAILASLLYAEVLEPFDEAALASFATGHRALSAILLPLKRLLLQVAKDPQADTGKVYQALVAHVFLARSNQQLFDSFGFTGQAKWVAAARAWVGNMIRDRM